MGDNPASIVYVRHKQEAAVSAGMQARDVHLPATISQSDLIATVRRLSTDTGVHGILVQLPLPAGLDEYAAIDAIEPIKDVDGLHPVNMGLLVEGRQRFVPATPAGCEELLVRSGFPCDGKHVVVVGRSDIVGKPVSLLLMQKRKGANATVTVCHSRTTNLAEITRQADILIAAIGKPRFITAGRVKQGVVVIDVGINEIAAPERKRGYRLVGDVDFDRVAEKAAAITPVPGGVGPMTIAMLLKNTLKAARLQVEGER